MDRRFKPTAPSMVACLSALSLLLACGDDGRDETDSTPSGGIASGGNTTSMSMSTGEATTVEMDVVSKKSIDACVSRPLMI